MNVARWRAKQKELGLCQNCTTPVVPGRCRCQYHLDCEKARQAKKKERGLCQNCTNPAVPGKSKCAHHGLMDKLRGHPAQDAKHEAKDLQKLKELQNG